MERKARKDLKEKVSWEKTNAFLYIILPLFIVIMALLISERHYLRWDLTSTAQHTLSHETLQVLKNVKSPIRITAFVREGYQEKIDAEKLLSAYHYFARDISFRLIDPDRNPALTHKYGVKSVNTFILEGYGRQVKVLIPDEESITNGILKLITGKTLKVYWLTGHGERSFRGSAPDTLSYLYENLKDKNYEFIEISLIKKKVPEDASLLVISAPIKPLLAPEIANLKEYIEKGGSILIFLEPFMDGGLTQLLSDYGISIGQDIVVDKVIRIMAGDYLMPMVTDYGVHKITDNFKVATIFPTVRSVTIKNENIRGMKLTPLALTSSISWAERNKEDLKRGIIEFNEQDRRGPVSIAVICEKATGIKDDKKGTKIVVFGDVDFATNKYIKFVGNEDLIKNTIKYLAERGKYITIKKKHRPIEALMLTEKQGKILFGTVVVFIPMLVLIAGVVVWFRRRAK